MVELAQIKTLVLIAELGSLAAAARKLNVSPAAISKQLSRLEGELGLQLLVRSTRKLEFTEIGENYCSQCQRILEEMAAAEDLVSNMKSTPHGTLKIFSGRHFATAYIVPHIKEFLTLYPKIEISLDIGERIPDLGLEAIDILIGMSLSAAGDVIQRRISTTSYVFCASQEYIEQFGMPMKPEDLHTHRYITHSKRKPDNKLVFNNKDSITIKPYLAVNDTELMLQLAQEGVGIVKLHRYVVEESLKQGRLIELLDTYTKEEVPLYVAYPHHRFIATKVRVFIDFIRQYIND